jgi:hypothetical protein
MMNTCRAGHTLVIVVGLLMAGLRPAVAGSEAKAAGGGAQAAAARIEAMAHLLAKAPRLGVTVDCIYDVVQDSGEKIEFGERRALTLRRPDRARFDITGRDGSQRTIFFDGTQLTTFDRAAKVYATVPSPGTVDAALAYYTRALKMRLPLRELFAADLPQRLQAALGSARWVGEETVAAVATDHVAFRDDTVDVQLWIALDGAPLPQRIVITYRLAAGQPQFQADFQGWTLSPEVPDAAFTFVPPPDAERIPIRPSGRGRAPSEPQP